MHEEGKDCDNGGSNKRSFSAISSQMESSTSELDDMTSIDEVRELFFSFEKNDVKRGSLIDVSTLKGIVAIVVDDFTDLPTESLITDATLQFPVKLSHGMKIPRLPQALLYKEIQKTELKKLRTKRKVATKKWLLEYQKKNELYTNEFPPMEYYIINESDLAVLDFPLPSKKKKENQPLETRPLEQGKQLPKNRRYLALDCEMCLTTKGNELARITLVDETEQVIYDKLVLPDHPIVDYCTPFSGITPDILEGCKTTKRMVQKDFLDIVSAETILVGHSLENDLRALDICHRKIVDTVILYPHPNGLPHRSALRYLAQIFLKQTIQRGNGGHCSAEDAIAALRLAKLKVARGPTYGESNTMQRKSLLVQLGRANKKTVVIDLAKSCGSLVRGLSSAHPCTSYSEVVQKTISQLKREEDERPHFIVARLQGPDEFRAPNLSKNMDAPTPRMSLMELQKSLKNMQNSLPENFAMIVVTQPNQSELADLHQLRTGLQSQKSCLQWTIEHQERLVEVQRRSQVGSVYIVVSTTSSRME